MTTRGYEVESKLFQPEDLPCLWDSHSIEIGPLGRQNFWSPKTVAADVQSYVDEDIANMVSLGMKSYHFSIKYVY